MDAEKSFALAATSAPTNSGCNYEYPGPNWSSMARTTAFKYSSTVAGACRINVSALAVMSIPKWCPVILSGPAGSGKSQLVHELAAKLGICRVVDPWHEGLHLEAGVLHVTNRTVEQLNSVRRKAFLFAIEGAPA